jgi:flagellar hook protein FlgE
MGSFSSALSGLNSASVDLSVISNDLANLNTVGYKSSDANFQDLFYQQIGSSAAGNPQEVGSGVTVGSISSNFTEGTISATGVPTDVAVDGEETFPSPPTETFWPAMAAR